MSPNHVLMLTHNCQDLTKKAVESALEQDIPVAVWIFDNGSQDRAAMMFAGMRPAVNVHFFGENLGVSKGWNFGLDFLFSVCGAEHVLVSNNDVVLPPFLLRTLLESGEKFITGVSLTPEEDYYWSCGRKVNLDVASKSQSPDFSAFLIRREVWEKVGKFDERMKFYVQDADYHIRMHQAGIWAGAIPLGFYHYRSATLRTADETERREIENQANLDRQVFLNKWGCAVGSEECARLCTG